MSAILLSKLQNMSFANIILVPEIVKGKQPPFMAFLFSSSHEELQDKE